MIDRDLTERARSVLKNLIKEYVRTGRPVGSRRLAKLDPEGMSPATIRNVVADLEEMGFVTQPHTSAGRIPTARGYRLYVDALLESHKLSSTDVTLIRESIEIENDAGELMTKTSRILSALSSNLGFVVSPPLSSTVMRRIEFIRIAPGRILAIVVTQQGLVQHRTVQLDQDFERIELEQASRYLDTHFSGRTLGEIRDELHERMKEEKALYDRLLRNVILLGSVGLSTSDEESSDAEVYFGTASTLIQKPEMSDVDRIMTLLRTVEEKGRLARLISECLRVEPSRPMVTIGMGDLIPEMEDWTIIACPYRCDDQTTGSLGVIGPPRMEYGRAISLVDYVAKLFGKRLSQAGS